jgi:hypothetical protein
VPDHVRDGLRRVTDVIDDLRTARIRLGKAAEEHAAKHPRPERAEPAERLRQAAMHRDAPIELVRLARAVQDGRTTWQAVVSGQADTVPEVMAVQARARQGIARLVDRPREPEQEPPQAEAPAPDDDGFTSIYDR